MKMDVYSAEKDSDLDRNLWLLPRYFVSLLFLFLVLAILNLLG